MSTKIPLKTIVTARTADQAKLIAKAVNQGSYALKGKIALTHDELTASLEGQDWDVVLVHQNLPEDVNLESIIDTIQQNNPLTPVVVITDTMSEELRTTTLQAGARDAVSYTAPALLDLILKRELPNNPETATPKTAPSVARRPQAVAMPSACVVDQESLSDDDKEWAERINVAIQENHFLTVFQPIVNLNAEPAANYELLLRMRGKDGEEISPAQFIGPAEKSCMMASIDRWVIERAIHTLLEHQKDEPNTRFFIKLSRQSLFDEEFLPWLAPLVEDNHVPANSLVFELTELDSLAYEAHTKKVVAALKHINCMVTIDHVGSAEDREDTWRTLNPDYIKLSGHLTRELTEDKDAQNIVRRISGHAKNQNVLTIAQFVQDPSTLAFLWQRGINYIQGYYLQRPDTTLNYDFSPEEIDEVTVV